MSIRASENIRRYINPNGPEITSVTRNIIEEGGLYFKDIDGSGTLSEVNDWRRSPKERAAAYVKKLAMSEKLGQLFTAQCRMGIHAGMPNPMMARMGATFDVKVDETGLLDETVTTMKNIFGEQKTPGTTVAIKELWQRHMIFRESPAPDQLADWINQLQLVAEECAHFVPVQVMSNSRNENGQVVFGMNDAAGVFPTWPGTLGIAAAVKGDSIKVADEWAEAIRRDWDAVGLKKGYMYMADVLSDPRWQRNYGTFGEDPRLICDILDHIIPRIQGGENGVTADGIAMTVKHFPGGGARENGFDPHYKMGQWNMYRTPGSLMDYHVPPFKKATEKGVASIMPYYAKPSAKSAAQSGAVGTIDMQPYGFAYNKAFIADILRGELGFKGYINSDTGILHNMAWGVEKLDIPERIAFAVNHAGVDLISGMLDIDAAREAFERASNGYYDEHPIPEGFTKEMLILTDEALDRAVARTLESMFALGVFESPYRDPANAVSEVATPSDWDNAAAAHRKSVVLLKNDGVLPLKPSLRIYAEAFCKKPDASEKATVALREMLTGVTIVEDPAEADAALLMITPASGEYFSATKGYLEIDICDGKTVCDVDDEGRPAATTHEETTISGAARIAEIAAAVHANCGKVIANVNVTLPWLMGNVEKHCDALTVGFDTYPSATLDVIFGRYIPTGKLPVTLPRSDAVIAVDADGRCISPNDVPGFDKDKYIPDALKDENGKAYAYRDAAGSYYEYGFGLTY